MKVIVTRYEPIKHYVKENAPKMDIVWNDHPERGISESIHLGIRYLRQSKDYEKYAGCCFMVCDQPWLEKTTLVRLKNKVCKSFLKAFTEIQKESICV